jgi:8-oxo-dGTP pyrophosphatase MutT (NUDIX family)
VGGDKPRPYRIGDRRESVLKRPVHPRKAATLILLREGDGGLEVLLGRRGAGARFMPGMYVFPGGRVQPSDARPFHGETQWREETLVDGLRAAARAALRETFEETGVLLGREAILSAPRRALSEVETAYHAAGLAPAVDALLPVARAITPTASPMRFHVRFFVADGRLAGGEMRSGEELENVAWHCVEHALPAPISGVTSFMLRHAIAVHRGTARSGMPLYWHRKGTSKVWWRDAAPA